MERIGIFGVGNVGKALASRLSGTDLAKDVYLYGKNGPEIEGLALDLNDAQFLLGGPLFHPGKEEDIATLDFVVVTAGVRPNVHQGGDRNTGMEEAFEIVRDIAGRLEKQGYDRDVLVATNPLDVMTYAMKLCLPQCPVYGTGTLLEAARLGRFLADRESIDPSEIFPMAIGEHGPNTVLLARETRIGDHFLSEEREEEQKKALHHVIHRGTDIAKLRSCTTEGIAASILTILQARDGEEEAVLPLSYPSLEEGIAISQKILIGRDGIRPLPEENDWSEEEKAQFVKARKVIRKNIEGIEGLRKIEKGADRWKRQ